MFTLHSTIKSQAELCFFLKKQHSQRILGLLFFLLNLLPLIGFSQSLPCVSVSDTTIAEGNSGQKTIYFRITVDKPATDTIRLGWWPSNVPNIKTATSGADYTYGPEYVGKDILIAPGETVKDIPFYIKGDKVYEGDQEFLFVLSKHGKNFNLCKNTGKCIIINDDDPPILNVLDTMIIEGNQNKKTLYAMVKLEGCSDYPIKFNCKTTPISASPGSDYDAVNGSLIIPPNKTYKWIMVNINGDTAQETDEEFLIEITSADNATLGKAQAKVILLNDDNRTGKPLLSGNDFRVKATDAFAPFALQLSNPSADTVKVNYATANGSAFAGFDYTATNGTVTFLPGETSAIVTVSLLNNTSGFEKTLLLNLTEEKNAYLIDNQIQATIVNSNDTTLSLPKIRIEAPQSVSESEDDVSITIRLSKPFSLPVTLNYKTAGVTANPGEDYEETQGIVTIAPGSTVASFSVKIIAGDIFEYEPTESFLINFIDPVNGTLEKEQVSISIRDAYFYSNATVETKPENESKKSIQFIVYADGYSDMGLYVEYTTEDSTAIAGVDYQAKSDLLWLTGFNTHEIVTIPITDNTIVDGNRIFKFKWRYLGGTYNVVEGVIIDDDANKPEVHVNQASFSEASGQQNILVYLSNPSTNPVNVDFNTNGGTALFSDDFLLSDYSTITFEPGETERAIGLKIINDALVEGNETIHFNITAIDGGTTTDSLTVFTIIDDDLTPVNLPELEPGAPQVGGAAEKPCLSISDLQVKEGDTGIRIVEFEVTLDKPSDKEIKVKYYPSESNDLIKAAKGLDFSYSFGTVVFAPGETQKKGTVGIGGDKYYESDQEFYIILSNPINASICKEKGVITILNDDDKPKLSVLDTMLVEGNEGSRVAYFKVVPNVCSDYPISFDFDVTTGTAKQGVDYYSRKGRLQIPPKKTYVWIPVRIQSDTITEADETFFLKISNPENAEIERAKAKATILDDDNRNAIPILSISDVNVNENASNATFLLKLSNASNEVVSIDYKTEDGPLLTEANYNGIDGVAKQNKDYTSVNGTLNFPPGTINLSVSVPIIDDTESEYLESFLLKLSNPINAIVLDYSGKASISDNDNSSQPTILIDTLTSASEVEGFMYISMVLNKSFNDTVKVNYTTVDNTATAGEDYVATSGTVIFLPGQLNATVSIPVNEDGWSEGAEYFNVNFSNPINAFLKYDHSNCLIRDGSIQTAHITVMESAVTEGTNGNYMTFNVYYDGCSDSQLMIEYETANGTAIEGQDYIYTRNVLDMGTGCDQLFIIHIPIINDTLSEGNETLFLKWRYWIGDPGSGPFVTVKGTILDNDVSTKKPIINLVPATFSESDPGKHSIDVTLSEPSTVPVTFYYQDFYPSTAFYQDFILLPFQGWATFEPGETLKKINLWIYDDKYYEGDEQFAIRVSQTVDYSSNVDTLYYVIHDNDPAPKLSIADAEANEADGTIIFEIKLTGQALEPITVDYTTLNNTASSGSDYTAISGTMKFYSGSADTYQTITVPLVNDGISEGAESFYLSLSNITNATLTNAQAIGTINDDSPVFSLAKAPERTTNVFTPNGDGINDLFYLEGIENVQNELVVLNKSGKQVFKKTNYQNDWDGSGVPDGTYFYFLKTKDSKGVAQIKKGFVAVLRQQSK